MRIIGGKYKHLRISVPSTFKARPTTDFAKENLFNILAHSLLDFDEAPAALDLFAGTGSISVELLSRGCAPVVSVEKDFRHHQFLQQTARQVNDPNWRLVRGDAFRFIASNTENAAQQFDLVFADPPYALPNLAQLPQLILASALLKPDGILVLEHGKDHNFSHLPQFMQQRAYGSVNFSFFTKQS